MNDLPIEMPFRILQNTAPGFGHAPDTGEWVLAHSGVIAVDPANTSAALELLFNKYNRGSGQEAADFPASMRSLSVGDRVVLGEVTFVCASRGWEAQ